MRLQPGSIYPVNLSARREGVFFKNVFREVRSVLSRVASRFSPLEIIAHVKILACDQPLIHHILFSWNTATLCREVRCSGFAATISDNTVGCWLHEVVIHPWHYCSWMFPRNPQFAVETRRSWISMKTCGMPPQRMMKKPASKHTEAFMRIWQIPRKMEGGDFVTES
jgi:hypothetical protein